MGWGPTVGRVEKRAATGSVAALALVALVATGALAGGPEVVDGDQFGTSGYDSVYGMDADGKGTYLAGSRAWVGGSGNGFVRMLKPGGGTKWTHSLATAGDDEYIAVTVTDDAIYAAGETTGYINDPDRAPRDDYDAFVERLRRSDGSRVWIKRIRSPEYDFSSGIAVKGNAIYVSGHTTGELANCTPDPCGSLGDQDGFLRRFSTAGAQVWTRQFGTSGYDSVSGAVSKDGAIFVGGLTYGVMQPGYVKTSGSEAYVRRYTPSGAITWTRQFGMIAKDGSMSARDLDGNGDGVYLVGALTDAIAGTTHTVDGVEDAYIRMYGFGGGLRDTRQFGSDGDDSADAVFGYAEGIVVGGTTDSDLYRPNPGEEDGWVRRLSSSSSGLSTAGSLQFGNSVGNDVYAIARSVNGVFVGGDTAGDMPGCSPPCQNQGGHPYDAYWLEIAFP